MDKRAYEDKRLKDRQAYPWCVGGCHPGIPKGLAACPCKCHLEPVPSMASKARVERLTTIVGGQ